MRSKRDLKINRQVSGRKFPRPRAERRCVGYSLTSPNVTPRSISMSFGRRLFPRQQFRNSFFRSAQTWRPRPASSPLRRGAAAWNSSREIVGGSDL